MIKAKKYQGNYHHFDIPCESKDEKYLFVCSDVHFDNPKCDRDLFFKHMDRALERDAMIVITGDLFCLMQGKYDPRKNKSAIRPEHNKDNYLDLVINDTADKFVKYAKNILLISRGNHESGVSQRAETDIMERFVERLNLIAGSNVQVGNYRGYYTLGFHYQNGSSKRPISVGYSHGNWGGVITKGTLSVVRNAAIMPDCDIMFTGHTHDSWVVTQPRYKRNEHSRRVEIKNQWHVKTGTYKEEFGKGKGWAVEKIAMPKHLGGCFVKFDFNKHKDTEFEITLTH